jgi:hypothetical protein
MAITILELAKHRGATENSEGCFSFAEIQKNWIAFYGWML